MADLETGDRQPTRERLAALFDELSPVLARLGSQSLEPRARELLHENGAMRQRAAFNRDGAIGVASTLVDRFEEPYAGLEPPRRG